MNTSSITTARRGMAYGFFKAEKATPGERPGDPTEPVTRVRIARAFAMLKADPDLRIEKGLDLRVSLLYIGNGNTLFFRRAEPPLELFGVSDLRLLIPLTFITFRMGVNGANCMVKAYLDGADNGKAAFELRHALNLLYSCAPALVVVKENSKGGLEPVGMDIFFRNENGVYVSSFEPAAPTMHS